MLEKQNIDKIISQMTENLDKNIQLLKKHFGSLEFLDDTKQTLLHIFVDNIYDEDKCFLAIKSLLDIGINPNAKDEFEYIFIQTALYAGYSEKFIIDIINLAFQHGLNVNHVDSDSDTIMHTAIYSDDYLGEVINIYKVLLEKGFDSSKKDHDGRNLIEAMIFQNQYTEAQIHQFNELYVKNIQLNTSESSIKVETVKAPMKQNISVKQLSEKQIEELEECGTILNKKQYFSSPTIGREKELKNLLITLAQEKKSPLIVGDSGVGKTAVVDELVYRIQNEQVPAFLKNQIVLEITPSDVEAKGARWVGEFEKAMKKLLKTCEKYDVILFIDEIHTIYGTGAGSKSSIDMSEMLKHYLDRTNLKIIGTTTSQEYSKYFANSALKRRFEIITVKEPEKEMLSQILDKVIADYYLKTGITFKDKQMKEQVINIILELTQRSHRDYSDVVNNPDLSISIIDKAFAIANLDSSEYIEPSHFIESLNYCDRIYTISKQKAISKLRNISIPEKGHEQGLIIDFKKR